MNTPLKKETRTVRHNFSQDELRALGQRLAQELSSKATVMAEFESVKKDYKSKEAKADAEIQAVGSCLINGFELRSKQCAVVYRPRDRQKDYYLEEDIAENAPKADAKPVMTVDMTQEDFQQELIQAESIFGLRKEIPLAPPVDSNFVTLVVGMFNDKWYSALRIKIGSKALDERLDSEQKAFKFREDAVKFAGKRATKWFKDTFDEQIAKGFEDHISKTVESQKGLVE